MAIFGRVFNKIVFLASVLLLSSSCNAAMPASSPVLPPATPQVSPNAPVASPTSPVAASSNNSSIAPAAPKPLAVPTTVGHVSRHAASFVNKTVTVAGYILVQNNNYIIISDEASGAIGIYDLPVRGPGTADLIKKVKYIFTGIFTFKGLQASNGSPYHLELSAPPTPFIK